MIIKKCAAGRQGACCRRRIIGFAQKGGPGIGVISRVPGAVVMFSYGPGMLLVVLSWPLFVESAVYRTTRHPAGLLLKAGACGFDAPLVKSHHTVLPSAGSSYGSLGTVFEADSSRIQAMPSEYPVDTERVGVSSTCSDCASFNDTESSATMMTWSDSEVTCRGHQ